MTEVGSTSLQRAIEILDALATCPATERGGLGVVEVSRVVGREKSQVSRTLKMLADAGLADRDPDTLAYRLGWRMFTLAAAAADQHLLAVAPGVLRRLTAVVGERTHLSTRVGTEVLTLMSEGRTRAIEASDWIGRAAPLHTTSAGRVLLFDHTDEEVRDLLADTPFDSVQPSAPHDVADLLDRLRLAREQGYAVIDEEHEIGLVAAAAPVRDFRGRTIAALNISAPKFRLGRHLREVGEQVMAAANHLSEQLNSRPAAQPTGQPSRRQQPNTLRKQPSSSTSKQTRRIT